MKITDWLKNSTAQLEESSISTSRLDAQLILCNSLNVSRAWVLANPNIVLDTNQIFEINKILARRLRHEPLAYIFGHKEFYRRDFLINEYILVPRPESESIIELTLSINKEEMRLIDVGCGSGVLGITIALEKPDWFLTLSDISPDALSITKTNLIKHRVGDRVDLVEQDLLGKNLRHYDIIIANLPYVPLSMKDKIDLQAEPSIALFSKDNGLDHYLRLFKQISSSTVKPLHVITESMLDQHDQLRRLALSAGYTLEKTNGLGQHYILA